MRVLLAIMIGLFMFVGCFLIIAFIEWSLDPSEWGKMARTCGLFVGLFIAVGAAVNMRD